jgi:GGDEF domain-containing protein
MNEIDRARLQQKLEDVLDMLCRMAKRDIFVVLPKNKNERISYLKKEIKNTLEKLPNE